jgi:hypothetical protein
MPGLALGEDQIGVGDDEQRRAHHGQAKIGFQNVGKGHRSLKILTFA